MPQFNGYITNSAPSPFSQINPTDLNGNSVSGCSDQASCNYSSQAVFDDGSCDTYPEEYYDCSGNCINDSDSDGICDELEVSGCLDNGYVEFNPQVTEDDGTCSTTWEEGYNNLNAEVSNQSSQISGLQSQNEILASELSDVSDELDSLYNTPQCEEIVINIPVGWSFFGYTSSLEVRMADVMAPFEDKIYIIKDKLGYQYWPENNYDGIGPLTPGVGYQIYAYEAFSISFEN